MNDYERVAKTIRYLEAHRMEQPPLADLAAQAGLSAFHFHRLFSKWAGVTPKDFLQCLTVVDVKRRLLRGESALAAALESGLSGPGRLHDLCVTLEGASPGEIKSGGKGWIIEAGFANTPFGKCLIARGPRGICHLAFVEPREEEPEWSAVEAEWFCARIKRSDSFARSLVENIFRQVKSTGRRPAFQAYVKATPFQLRVWQALIRIPSGSLTSYGNLAGLIGESSAARAVGTAVGKNPIAYLIPCHRVIRATGVLGEYRWGPHRKRTLLAWEAAKGRPG